MIATSRTLLVCSLSMAVNLVAGCSAGEGEAIVDDGTDDSALATPAAVFCPVGSTFDPDYRLCATATEAFGPFPAKMVASCEASGGGKVSCASDRWAVALARGLRGKGECPPGTSRDGGIGRCADGDEIYGPFTVKDVEACKAKQGGAACESQRWSRSIVTAATYPYFYQYANVSEPSATCGITSAAMLLAFWGKVVSPDTLYDRFGKAKGQSPPGLESLYEAYGLYAASNLRRHGADAQAPARCRSPRRRAR